MQAFCPESKHIVCTSPSPSLDGLKFSLPSAIDIVEKTSEYVLEVTRNTSCFAPLESLGQFLTRIDGNRSLSMSVASSAGGLNSLQMLMLARGCQSMPGGEFGLRNRCSTSGASLAHPSKLIKRCGFHGNERAARGLSSRTPVACLQYGLAVMPAAPMDTGVGIDRPAFLIHRLRSQVQIEFKRGASSAHVVLRACKPRSWPDKCCKRSSGLLVSS